MHTRRSEEMLYSLFLMSLAKEYCNTLVYCGNRVFANKCEFAEQYQFYATTRSTVTPALS